MELAQPTPNLRYRHHVRCVYCKGVFDLFEATWCSHSTPQPSKTCPSCGRCLCRHPLYDDPRWWKEAPLGFKQRGFERLFLLYVASPSID